ncbi:GTP-binding protein Sar1A [Tieghemostelium lacteum]|uniref:GTP-binding protein Sar1A n=1 Tax=Tieghemostelium lacteum TaxID=361077 RepID=A0A152A4R8_TIELA|nr:GTP-binding protein Sar1A [Tieghemostelium lacteum]|eukprot:KYR01223.1 GTP-binding protein Sar1A [Tieghemostelium lacteum]
MFLIDWFWGVLSFLGLYNKNATLLFLGLDNAGKTTLLGVLKDGRLSAYRPTFHPTSEELSMGNIKFRTFDLGGHESARKIWKDYYASVDAIVYLVDSSNSDRFEESKRELDALLSSDELSNVPFLILGNKVDIPGTPSEEKFRAALGLQQTTGKGKVPLNGVRPIEVFMCSVVKKFGYAEGFRWISQYIN